MLLFIDILSSVIAVTGIGAAISSLITLIFSYLKKKNIKKNLEIKINEQIIKLPTYYSSKEFEEFMLEVLNKIKPRVFISYAIEDKALALALANKLESNGFDIWIDEYNIKLGDKISEKIFDGLKHSSYYLLVLTKNYVNSGWIKKEIELMLGNIENYPNRRIIPLLFDKEIKLPDLIKR